MGTDSAAPIRRSLDVLNPDLRRQRQADATAGGVAYGDGGRKDKRAAVAWDTLSCGKTERCRPAAVE